MALNNLTNFLNLIDLRRFKTTPELTDVIPLGTPDKKYDGGYKPTFIQWQDLVNYIGSLNTTVSGGTGISVVETINPNGTSNYEIVNADPDTNTNTSLTAGDDVTIAETTNPDGSPNYEITANVIPSNTLTEGANITLTPTINPNGSTNYEVASTGGGVDTNTWDITQAAFVDAQNGNNLTGTVGDGNLPFLSVSVAISASPIGFVIIKPCTINEGIQISIDNIHIHAMAGVIFPSSGGVTISGAAVNKFRFSGAAVFSGFSCEILRLFNSSAAEIDFEFDYADNVRMVVQNGVANSSNVRMNANWVKCHCYNGAGYAVRMIGNTSFDFNFKHHFHSQHTVAWARDNWSGRCIFTCPDIRVLPNYTLNYGNAQKQIFGLDTTQGAYLEVNGDQSNDHPTNAFGTVSGFYWNNQMGSPTTVVMNGNITTAQGIGIFGQFRSAYGNFTLNGNLTCTRNAFYSELTGWATPADQRYTFNGSIITSAFHMLPGRGKTYYFKDCAILLTEDGTGLPAGKNVFTPLEPGSPASPTQMYFYNTNIQALDPTAVVFNAWSVNFIVGTVNSNSNVVEGGPVTDAWTVGGVTVIPTLVVPKLS